MSELEKRIDDHVSREEDDPLGDCITELAAANERIAELDNEKGDANIQRDWAITEIERLKEALGKYGWHQDICGWGQGEECSCGFNDYVLEIGIWTKDPEDEEDPK